MIKAIIVAIVALVLSSVVLADEAQSPINVTGKAEKLYAVIFGIVVEADGTLGAVRVERVIHPVSGSTETIDIPIPAIYVEGAKMLIKAKGYQPKLKDGVPVEFFTYFLFDPANPEVVITKIK